ncbi:hypothetical protein ENBRE01_1955 [Enteropsectra breve]|nr:hypothetical protein ENBRE01_1955 [Enteropsectra breve]
MGLKYFISGPVVWIPLFILILFSSESKGCAQIFRQISKISFLRIADERGAILFCMCAGVAFSLFLGRTEKLIKTRPLNRFYLRTTRSRVALNEKIFAAFVLYICAYILKTANVINLFTIGTMFVLLEQLSLFFGPRFIADLSSTGFFISMMMVFCNIFILHTRTIFTRLLALSHMLRFR